MMISDYNFIIRDRKISELDYRLKALKYKPRVWCTLITVKNALGATWLGSQVRRSIEGSERLNQNNGYGRLAPEWDKIEDMDGELSD